MADGATVMPTRRGAAIMTTDHDSDPDATVKMPRPIAPKKEDEEVALEDVDPDSTLIRQDWGDAIIPPPPSATPTEPEPPAAPQQHQWERTMRRPAHVPEQESR